MSHIDDPFTQKANLAYIKDSMEAPMLSREEEEALAKAWVEDRDQKAMHKIVNAHRRLVVSMANKFKNYGLPLGDLIQEGNIGLMQAVERFDIEKEVRFSTYATWWIRSTIQDYVLRNWSIVRTGTTAAQKSLFFNLRRLKAQIDSEDNFNDALTSEDVNFIADELGVEVRDVEHMNGRMSGGDQSLNSQINDETREEWQNFLADDGPTPEDVVTHMKDSKSRSEWLNSAMRMLNDREKQIIRDRHLRYETVTLETLGDQLGISKERVRQIEKRAMEKLKINLETSVENPSDYYSLM
ncbi:MAG: RNA polymerase factor sigma-32 [Pseudomonadota bacterium]|jgi:RNA polymerase sigma-32 factor|nr:RNA polymerase factor sigma-32 [Pseudomonadota bacterium]